MTEKIDTRYLEIAIQTVLINYKQELKNIADDGNFELLGEISDTITRRALKFQHIAEKTIQEMEHTR